MLTLVSNSSAEPNQRKTKAFDSKADEKDDLSAKTAAFHSRHARTPMGGKFSLEFVLSSCLTVSYSF